MAAAKTPPPRDTIGMALAVRQGKMKRDAVPNNVRETVSRLAEDKSVDLEAFAAKKSAWTVEKHVGTNCGPVGRGGRVRYA